MNVPGRDPLERIAEALERLVRLEEVRLQRELGQGIVSFRSEYPDAESGPPARSAGHRLRVVR